MADQIFVLCFFVDGEKSLESAFTNYETALAAARKRALELNAEELEDEDVWSIDECSGIIIEAVELN